MGRSVIVAVVVAYVPKPGKKQAPMAAAGKRLAALAAKKLLTGRPGYTSCTRCARYIMRAGLHAIAP
ncbi:hypothetical protein [Undibacterium sp.]|uniref:hypothetical protein n=1 Tax=Undibacterium sp. TaxID=1914977 RepID=UPI00374D4D88